MKQWYWGAFLVRVYIGMIQLPALIKQLRQQLVVSMMSVLLIFALVPSQSYASVEMYSSLPFEEKGLLYEEDLVLDVNNFSFPEPGERAPKYVMNVLATAYSSDVWQTNDQPCIPADFHYNLCETFEETGVADTIAANFLPLGTKVRINGKMYTVRDRMNKKYNGTNRIDVYMAEGNESGKLDARASREAARQFGVQRFEMEVF